MIEPEQTLAAMALGQCLLLAAILLRDLWYALVARVFFLLVLAVSCYLLKPLLTMTLTGYWFIEFLPTSRFLFLFFLII